ncbi:MAG: hypothetical protein RL026_109 [Pseudomonadota bacterium]|jgi:hypothetical protein
MSARHRLTGLFALLMALLLLVPAAWSALREQRMHAMPAPDIAAWVARAPEGWTAEPLADGAVAPQVDDSYEATYDAVVMRQFTRRDGATVQLVLTWSRDGLLRAGHDQEYCYKVQGYDVQGLEPFDWSLRGGRNPLRGLGFSGLRPGFVEQVAYWRITGGRPEVLESQRNGGAGLVQQRLEDLRRRLIRDLPDNLMVRLSVRAPRAGHDAAYSQQVLEDFARAWLATLSTEARDAAVGVVGL